MASQSSSAFFISQIKKSRPLSLPPLPHHLLYYHRTPSPCNTSISHLLSYLRPSTRLRHRKSTHQCSKNLAHHHSVPERIQLAPLRCDPFDFSAPASVGMQRQHSVSSATDSGMSSYYGSASGSPTLTPCGSRRLGRTPTSRVHPYSPSSRPSFEARCTSCLDHGDHVPVQPGHPCSVCDTIYTEQRPVGKATRRKRNDRHLYSRLATGGAKSQGAMTKDQVEAGNRMDHTALLGRLQNQLLSTNPNLPTEARIGDGRSKLGWKVLNPNNVSKDVPDPLTFNKKDVLGSALQWEDDSDKILVNTRDYMYEQEQKAAKLLRSTPTYDQLFRLVKQISHSNGAARIEAARASRGTHSFHVPFGPESKL